jgi:hypothetical protein
MEHGEYHLRFYLIYSLASKSGIELCERQRQATVILTYQPTIEIVFPTVTKYDEWDHIVRIVMLGLFQYVMRNWRSGATATLGTDVTLHTTLSLQFCPSHIGHTLIYRSRENREAMTHNQSE